MKMNDAGQTRKQMYGDDYPVESSSKKGKEKKIYPHLDLNSNQLPEIKDMKVGEKCMLVIEVKPTRYSINDQDPKEEAESQMCFEVLRVGKKEKKGNKVDEMMDKMYSEKEEDEE
jgi:2,3-bisphosphoglycerate-independent phosphoglycerate mutase